MKKSLSAALSLILVLALCLSLAACGDKSDSKAKDDAEQATEAPEPGVAVGDTFTYVDFPITVTKISEDTEEDFPDAGEPEGKFVVIEFDADTSQASGGSYSMDNEKFKIDGVAAKDASAQMGLKNGQLDYSDLTMVVLFDVDKNADLNYLHLTVE